MDWPASPHPTPETRTPKHESRNPNPETRNPKSETENLEPETQGAWGMEEITKRRFEHTSGILNGTSREAFRVLDFRQFVVGIRQERSAGCGVRLLRIYRDNVTVSRVQTEENDQIPVKKFARKTFQWGRP